MHKSKKGVLIAVIVICALIALGACGYLVYKTIISTLKELQLQKLTAPQSLKKPRLPDLIR